MLLTMATIKEQITERIAGMIYLSESEAELQLLEWPEVKDVAGMQQKAASEAGQSMMKLRTETADEWLGKLQQSADPADPEMMSYVRKYKELFTVLKKDLKDLTVILAGQGTVHIYIGGFADNTCLVISTTAVET